MSHVLNLGSIKSHRNHLRSSSETKRGRNKGCCFQHYRPFLLIVDPPLQSITMITWRAVQDRICVEMPHCNTVALPVPIATYLVVCHVELHVSASRRLR